MRRIKIQNWKASFPVKENGIIVRTEDIDENLLMALNVLIGMKDPAHIRGFEKFRIFNKIAEAFDKADKTKVLELEDREYEFLKECIETEIPSAWGLNKNLSNAINDFLELKKE